MEKKSDFFAWLSIRIKNFEKSLFFDMYLGTGKTFFAVEISRSQILDQGYKYQLKKNEKQ